MIQEGFRKPSVPKNRKVLRVRARTVGSCTYTSRNKVSAVLKESRTPSCKGINVLLSGVLLVAIVALLSIVILNWVTTYTKTQQSTIETRALNCTGADVSIHTIFIDLSSNTSRISVRNSGFAADKIVDAAVINKQGAEAANLTAFPIDFPDGGITTISFNISGVITACANFSKAIVSTQCTSDDQDKPVACS